MLIDRKIREELNALSLEVYGVSSKWQKLLERGTNELITKTVTETVPGENGQPDETKEVQVPDTFNGVNQYRHRNYTLDEVKTLLLSMKKSRDEIIAKMKEAQAKREFEKKIHEENKGTVAG